MPALLTHLMRVCTPRHMSQIVHKTTRKDIGNRLCTHMSQKYYTPRKHSR
jgi:hypothetical protein